jgi:hypothetical protein
VAFALHEVVATVAVYLPAIKTAEQTFHIVEREDDAVLEVRSAILAEKAEFGEEHLILLAKTGTERRSAISKTEGRSTWERGQEREAPHFD